MRHICKAIVMDVDGSLTDGGIYIGEHGEIMKRFSVIDGYAIKHILPEMGVLPIVITGRQSKITEYRCKELGIDYVFQNIENKENTLEKIIKELGLDFKCVAYFGDDVNDLNAMNMCGIKGAPSNAIQEIKKISHFVADKNGGYGALREFVDWIRGVE